METPRRKMPRVLRSLLSSVPGMVGATIVLVVVLMAIFADVITPHDPGKLNASRRLQPPSIVSVQEGVAPNYLGTDALGRVLL